MSTWFRREKHGYFNSTQRNECEFDRAIAVEVSVKVLVLDSCGLVLVGGGISLREA